MAKIREYGLRGPKGSAFVVDKDRTGRDGYPIPIVSLDYDLNARKVVWRRERPLPHPDDDVWEEADWAGAREALWKASANPNDVAEHRDRYIELFKRLAAAGLLDAEWIVLLE
jgi:hypothetical protein